jgi:hypothetical protein
LATEIPTVKYCALVNGPCYEHFETPSDTSVFCAYPAIANISGEMKEASDLARKRGMKVTTWEELPREDRILFCKICHGIMEARCLWAEITHPNSNVFFEIGYALARGKTLRLIKDASITTPGVSLISSIEQINYQNVYDLLDQISQPVDNPLARTIQHQAGTHSDSLHALFCRAEFRTTAAEKIYRQLNDRLRPHGTVVHVDDRVELWGHDLVQLASLALRAQLVVINLAASERKDSNVYNAASSLIAGYAMGAGRKVLVLQESPADPMLDLQNVRKEYHNAREAQQILEKWLNGVISEVKVHAREIKEEQRKRQTSLQRWALDLGNFATEFDARLSECFVETDAYKAASNGTRQLFVGRRGSGKTANCRHVEYILQNRANVIVSLIEPDELQLRDMAKKVETILERPLDAAVYRTMWRFVLCGEMAAAVVRHYNERPNLDHGGTANALAKALTSIGSSPEETFDERMLRAMEKLHKSTAESISRRDDMLQRFHNDEIAKLLEVLRHSRNKEKIYVLIDNLDKDWSREHESLAIGLINGLLNEAQRLSYKDLSDVARIIVFLRSDIYEIVSGKDPERDKKSPLFLEWSPENLFGMVITRIRAGLRDAGEKVPDNSYEVWKTVFVEKMPDGTPSFDYLTKRTMFRPRDILQFCTRCLDRARQNGHNIVTVEDISKAEEDYSRDLENHLKQEYAVGYPDIDTLAITLLNRPARMQNRHFKSLLSEAATNEGLVDYTLDDLCHFCYDTGIIGVELPDNVFYSFKGTSYDIVHRHITTAERNDQPVWVNIHQGLHKAWSIKSSVS